MQLNKNEKTPFQNSQRLKKLKTPFRLRLGLNLTQRPKFNFIRINYEHAS